MEDWGVDLMATFGQGQRKPRSWPARGGDIHMLKTPTEFYDTIMDGVSKATRRISLAALYLGTGEKEEALIQVIYSRLEEVPSLEVNLLVDHSRGLRGRRNSTTTTTRLVAGFPDRVNVWLYQMPQARQPLTVCLPSPLNEIVGVLHLKCCVFDDDVIMSGANLSHDYFTHRMDRYMLIKGNGCPGLGELYHKFVAAVGSASMKLQPHGRLQAPFSKRDGGGGCGGGGGGVASMLVSNKRKGRRRDEGGVGLNEEEAAAGDGDGGGSVGGNGDVEMHLVRQLEGLFLESGAPDSINNCEGGRRSAATRSKALTGATAHGGGGGGGGDGEWDTVIFPSVQHPAIGIRWDEQMTLAILRSQSGPLGIASAYLNLPPAFQRILLERRPPPSPPPPLLASTLRLPWTTLLTAATTSHGYATATGPKALIPKLYDSLLDDLLNTLRQQQQHQPQQEQETGNGQRHHHPQEHLSIIEYSREGWTFHCKGLWGWQIPHADVQEDKSTTTTTTTTSAKPLEQQENGGPKVPQCALGLRGGPAISMIGSSNMGRRSTDRDLESNFYVVTSNRQLRHQFQLEWEALADHAVPVSLAPPPVRRTNFMLRNIARYAKPLL